MPRSSLKRILGASLLAGGLMLACSDKGVEPKAGRYRLYVGLYPAPPDYREGWYVHVIDCQSDSVVDSIVYPFTWLLYLTASPDGRFLGVHPGGPPMLVWDLQTKALAASLPDVFNSLLFLPEDKALLATSQDSTFVFATPRFELDTAFGVELLCARRIGGTSRVIGIESDRPAAPPRLYRFLVFDYIAKSVVDSFVIESNDELPSFQANRFVLSPDGKRLYAMGWDLAGAWLLGYDILARRTLFRYRTYLPGYCQVTPDGREVWLTPGGTPAWDPWPQLITVVDAFTGALLDTIPVHASLLGWPRRVLPGDIRFLPSGEKAYVGCGRDDVGVQPLLVIDVKSRRILKVMYGDQLRIPVRIDLAPVP